MKDQIVIHPWADVANRPSMVVDRHDDHARRSAHRKRVILLVSQDAFFVERLRSAAEDVNRAIAQATRWDEALRQMRSVRPAAVLLDLDLPSYVAWGTADSLLDEEACPPLLLLSGNPERLDLSPAVRTGCLLDKSAPPDELLRSVDEAVAAAGTSQSERNAIQRVLIRWLKPCHWTIPVERADRFWGING